MNLCSPKLVLPLSTWPRTPTLTLYTLSLPFAAIQKRQQAADVVMGECGGPLEAIQRLATLAAVLMWLFHCEIYALKRHTVYELFGMSCVELSFIWWHAHHLRAGWLGL